MAKKILTKEEQKKKIMEDEDFIKYPRFFNSMRKFLAVDPEPLDDKAVARILLMEPEEVERLYNESVQEIKEELGEE